MKNDIADEKQLLIKDNDEISKQEIEKIKKKASETGAILRMKDGRVAYFSEISYLHKALKDKSLKYANFIEKYKGD